MKFLVSLSLLIAASVTADDKTAGVGGGNGGCLAENIVTNCLSTETKKADHCSAADWGCLCAAFEDIATCYDGCPNDPRAAPARQQVSNYCANASLYSSKTPASNISAVATASGSDSASSFEFASKFESTSDSNSAASSNTADLTANHGAPSKTASGSSRPAKTGAADALTGSTGSVFIAVAGVVAAVL